jgi:hypothetical protein
MNRLAPLAAGLLAATVLTLTGCYKSQYEGEKTRAADLDKRSKELQTQLDAAKSELASVTGRVQTLESQLSGIRSGGTLVAFIDGKPAGRESIRWDGTQWVRHGECVRAGGVVNFENGRLADQTLFMNQPSGRPWFTGGVKFGKPDGEWIWFDTDGKPHMRETWAAGKLTEVARASTAKGPLSWGKLNTKDREGWIKSAQTAAAMRELPELVRDTSAPAPAATNIPAAAGSSRKPAPAGTTKR